MFLWIENVINEMELGNGHIEANSHNEAEYFKFNSCFTSMLGKMSSECGEGGFIIDHKTS